MNCSRFESLLIDFLDERLDQPVYKGALAHMGTCAECAELARAIRSLRRAALEYPQIEFSDQLLDSILDQTTGRREAGAGLEILVAFVRPFFSQRFALATVLMFAFLTAAVSFLGPDFMTRANPKSLISSADTVYYGLYQKRIRFETTAVVGFNSAIEELKLLRENLSGRLNYHLITILFESYRDSIEESDRGVVPGSQDTNGE